ncbi:hypothetical protein BDQ17DRAFT_1358179 [Cyathus striatus]|nr:hypothetical protein BDQ17DRAFT_1358179 [Cyathus striatus]
MLPAADLSELTAVLQSNVIWKDNSVSLVNAQLYTTFQHRLSHVPLLPCTPYRFKDELARDEYKPSKLGDMYAISVLFYTIFSENEPYTEYALSKRVCKIACVGHSELRKPVLMPEHLWNVLVDCWSTRSEGREVAFRRLAAVLQ